MGYDVPLCMNDVGLCCRPTANSQHCGGDASNTVKKMHGATGYMERGWGDWALERSYSTSNIKIRLWSEIENLDTRQGPLCASGHLQEVKWRAVCQDKEQTVWGNCLAGPVHLIPEGEHCTAWKQHGITVLQGIQSQELNTLWWFYVLHYSQWLWMTRGSDWTFSAWAILPLKKLWKPWSLSRRDY